MSESGKSEKDKGKRKSCPVCGTEFLCLHNKDCWCMDYSLTAETLAYLRQNYNDCLCPACLSQHGLPRNDPGRVHLHN